MHVCRSFSAFRISFRPKLPLTALVLSALTACALQAQEPLTRPNRSDARGLSAAVAGAKEDPAAVERGAKAYSTHCAGCHGSTGRGTPGAPDLTPLDTANCEHASSVPTTNSASGAVTVQVGGAVRACS